MPRPLVIFDFDGTIADSFHASMLTYNRVAPRLGLRSVAPEEVPALRRMGAGAIMRTLGIPMWKLPRLLIAVRGDLYDHFHVVNPVDGIGRAIAELHSAGGELAIVTSNSDENVRSFLERNEIDGISTIVAGTSVFGKAARLRRLMKAAIKRNAPTFYVGDTPPDIRAAREAGAVAIAVTWGFADAEPLVAERPNVVLNRADELVPAIKRLLGGS
jgi:phosphoglycolate phosphatase